MAGSLGRRPQATVFSVEDLVERVRRGEVRIPRFQRRLRWKAEDVRLLFDSIASGYPVGSLLFWKKEAPPDSVRLGPVTVDAPASRDALWVVDGQQRITALVGALLHPDPVHLRDDFALGVDLETGAFVRSRASLPRSWMPLNVVLDTAKLLAWLDAYELRAAKPVHVGTAHRIAKALRDYQVPAYVVDADDEALVREVFGRLNAAGRRLTEDEVFDALAGSEGDAETGASTLQAISESVQELGFGKLERAWILKSVLAVAGLDFTRQGAADVPRTELKEIHRATARALREVVVFLKRDAGIAHAQLLPYSLPIAILAKFFHLHRSPKARSRDLLARWLWRGAITGQHKGESTPQVRQMLAVPTAPEEVAVQNLLKMLGPPFPGQLVGLQLASFSWRTARTKLEANALVARGPADLTTGLRIDVGSLIEEDGGSAFQPIIRLDTRHMTKQWRDQLGQTPFLTLASRVLHPKVPGILDLLKVALKRPDAGEILGSHFLHEPLLRALFETQHPWPPESAVPLLVDRSAQILAYLEQFLAAKARWEESDRPSIESLTVPDEDRTDA